MTPYPWTDVLIIAGLILLNAVFAMSELAIVSARPARLKVAADRGHKGARIALLLASDGPLSMDQLVRFVGSEFNLGKRELREALAQVDARFSGTASELKEVASGWRVQVRPEYAEWVGRLWQEKPPKYSRALLETLALIVYRQPITRGEIEQIRGVSVSATMIKSLEEREWIRVLGHRDVPGRPELFGTTKTFLDYFGLKSLDELPPLAELKDIPELEPQFPFDLNPPVVANASATTARIGSGRTIASPGTSAL